jgi:hypothetical protein
MNNFRLDHTYQQAALWQRRLDTMQTICVIFLFVGVFGLESVSKETAHSLVWVWAAIELVLMIITYIVQRKTDKARKIQYEAFDERMRIRNEQLKERGPVKGPTGYDGPVR